jgi:asparagine synthetase B (glutamine-hydrolysing)
LISGLGADEQLGGYSRHREAFRHGSWERLIQEVKIKNRDEKDFVYNHLLCFFLLADTIGC